MLRQFPLDFIGNFRATQPASIGHQRPHESGHWPDQKELPLFEDISYQNLEQMAHIFQRVKTQAANLLPKERPECGDLVTIDGFL